MRLPNPWVAVPILLAAVAGGVIGYIVTDASCAPHSCTVAAALFAVLGAAAAAIGVGVVVVLAVRSVAEWRETQDREIVIEKSEAGDE